VCAAIVTVFILLSRSTGTLKLYCVQFRICMDLTNICWVARSMPVKRNNDQSGFDIKCDLCIDYHQRRKDVHLFLILPFSTLCWQAHITPLNSSVSHKSTTWLFSFLSSILYLKFSSPSPTSHYLPPCARLPIGFPLSCKPELDNSPIPPSNHLAARPITALHIMLPAPHL